MQSARSRLSRVDTLLGILAYLPVLPGSVIRTGTPLDRVRLHLAGNDSRLDVNLIKHGKLLAASGVGGDGDGALAVEARRHLAQGEHVHAVRAPVVATSPVRRDGHLLQGPRA